VGKARQEAIEKVVDQLKDGKGRDQLKEKAKDLKNLGKNLRNLWR
jgi:cell division protein FtsB